MGARNVLATNLAKKISWGPRRAVKKIKKKSELSSTLLFIEEILGEVSGMAATMYHCKLRLKVPGMGS